MCKNMFFLRECLRVEVIGGRDKEFSWFRTFRHCFRQPKRRFYFWWRIASYLYSSGGKRKQKVAEYLNRKLSQKYGTEIEMGAHIEPGLNIDHFNGIVITRNSSIGKNFSIRQNTTIGINNTERRIKIGDNVYIGANSCIIGGDLIIGSNVVIGAMSFVNKDIAPNSVFYTVKESFTKCDTTPSA